MSRLLDQRGEQPSYYMAEALKEAEAAFIKGEVPVGAVIVAGDGAIVSRGHNLKESLSDPTAHAEVLALRSAAQHLNRWRMSGLSCYVTLEPCVMCAGALLSARIDKLYYAVDDAKSGAVFSLYHLLDDTRQNHMIAVEKGLMALESKQLLQSFFKQLRARNKTKRNSLNR